MKRTVPLHPLLFAIYPVVFAYGHNLEEATLADTVLPVAIVVGCTSVLWVALRFLYRDVLKAALVVSWVLLLFFSQGHILDLLQGAGVSVRSRHLLPVFTLMMFVVAWLVWRKPLPLVGLNKALNVVAVVLVGMGLATAVFTGPSAAQGEPVTAAEPWPEAGTTPQLDPSELPDIYYIIFDRYPRADVLKEQYDCDTSDFLAYLSSKGFYVASDSRSNYHQTWVSLASSLNMMHLQGMVDRNPASGIVRKEVHPMLEDNRLWRFLKKKGYTIVHFGSWWGPTMRNRFADVNVNAYALPELAEMIYSKTMLCPILARCGIYEKRSAQWKRVLYQFDKLAAIPEMKEPTFVFAHFLVPHPPYVFDSDGRFLSSAEEAARSREENLRGQVLFLNRKITELVDTLTQARVPPIIVLQADEGPLPRDMPEDYRQVTPAQLQEKMLILNACHLPGVPDGVLYPSITPVNTFRLVLNHYLGAHLDLLPDESYVTVKDAGRRVFMNVTKQLARPTGPERRAYDRHVP